MSNQEDKYEKVKIIISILTVVGACFAFFISNYTTSNNLIRQQQQEQELEFKKVLLSDRVSIYKDACKKVGDIIGYAGSDSNRLKESYTDFEKLYWGELSLIEDSSVIAAGVEFRNACRNFMRSTIQEEGINNLKIKAAKFTTACKISSGNSWNNLFIKQ